MRRVQSSGVQSQLVEREDAQVHRARLEPERWYWCARGQDSGSEQELVTHRSPEKACLTGKLANAQSHMI